MPPRELLLALSISVELGSAADPVVILDRVCWRARLRDGVICYASERGAIPVRLTEKVALHEIDCPELLNAIALRAWRVSSRGWWRGIVAAEACTWLTLATTSGKTGRRG